MLSALLGMTIGVASITGVHLLSAQISEQVRAQVEPVSQVDLYLSRPGLADDDYFALRADWRGGQHPRVAAIFPLIEGTVTYAEQTLLLTGTDPLALGFGSRASAAVDRSAATDTSAAALANDRPVAFDSMESYLLADAVYLAPSLRDQVEVGDTIVLGDVPVLVLGHSAPEGVVLADLPTARRVLGVTGLSRLGVVFTDEARQSGGFAKLAGVIDRLFPGALPARAAKGLSALPQSTQRTDWTQVSASMASPVVQLLQSVTFNVAMLSMLALVVAWLLTYQVACHALGRRQAMFARLQSLGVAKARLRRLTLVEGIGLGLLATLLGMALGVWLANLLYALMRSAEFAWLLRADRYVLLKALGSGVGVAGFSYWLAARDEIFDDKKSQIALPDQFQRGRDGLWLGGLLVVFFAGWLLPATGLPGAFACILCLALLLVVFLPRLAALAWRRTLPRQAPAASQSALRSPLQLLGRRQVLVGQELRLGISALTLALATALGISVMVDSFRGAFVSMLDRRLADDAVLVLREPASELVRAKLEQTLAAETGGSAGVGLIEGQTLWRGMVSIRSAGTSGRLEFAEHFDALLRRFIPPEAVPADLSTGVFINESYARLQNLQPGAVLELSGKAGGEQVLVRGIFTDYGEVRPRLLGSAALARQLAGELPYTDAYVTTQDLPALRAQLAAWSADARLQIRDQAQVRAQSLEVFEQTFAITRALTWLALLVAVVALGNALAAHSLQLASTDRQLQVLGVSRSAARRLRLQRTFNAAAVALLLAIPLGLAIAALLCGVVNPRAFGWSFAMQLTWSGMGWPLVGGVLGGVFGGVLGTLFAGHAGASLQRFRLRGVGHSKASVVAVVLLLVLVGCGDRAQQNTGQTERSSPVTTTPALRVGALLGGSADGFARATDARDFAFPRDHAAHPAFRSEWWYLTCPLRSTAGRDVATEYGVQFTLFRQGLKPGTGTDPWRSGQIYMAHAALTSVGALEHVESSRFARGHPRLAGVSAEPFAAWLENWRFEAVPDPAAAEASGGSYALTVDATAFNIALALQVEKPHVLQGEGGLSHKGSSEASYYYSLPRLSAQGHVQLGEDTQQSVTGACWFDREWSTSVLAEGLSGWDWFALQFDDNTELMLFQLRGDALPENSDQTRTAQDKFARRQGKAVAANGTARSLKPAELEFVAQRHWRDEAGIDWPVEWQVTVADRVLRVVAALDDQRMRETIAYWEGLVWVYDGQTRVGQGYLEMTGYAGPASMNHEF